jgi:hypothetical protein
VIPLLKDSASRAIKTARYDQDGVLRTEQQDRGIVVKFSVIKPITASTIRSRNPSAARWRLSSWQFDYPIFAKLIGQRSAQLKDSDSRAIKTAYYAQSSKIVASS